MYYLQSFKDYKKYKEYKMAKLKKITQSEIQLEYEKKQPNTPFIVTMIFQRH